MGLKKSEREKLKKLIIDDYKSNWSEGLEFVLEYGFEGFRSMSDDELIDCAERLYETYYTEELENGTYSYLLLLKWNKKG